MSTPPSLYGVIPECLAAHGLNTEEDGWKRIIVEKPFGYDAKTAKQLDVQIHRFFEEHQIYRIDHYLGKETVQNLLVLRFSNGWFEPLWNRNFIDYVEITGAEAIGVEERGGYYDGSGAMRDMFQNHLLQVLAMVAMEPPAIINANSMRDEVAKVMHSLRPLTQDDVEHNLVLGQYTAAEIDGKEYTIKAKAVIVATGGFGANAKMVEKYNPKLKGFGSTNNPAIVGDGIVMIEKIGGALVDMDQIQTHPTVLHKKTNMITEAVRGEGAILVNKDGKRFIDELETRDVVSKAILDQKGKSAFLIFDEEIRTKLKAADGYVKKGYAVEGTLEEIAAKIGADAKTLEATLNKYNEAVKNKADNEFKKKTLPKELTGDKYYVIEVSPAVHHTMGGVRINTNAEVLGKNGRPIKGLYAAGEITGGIHGANRIGGNAVTDITVFGKIAGENAATYSKSVK